MRKVTLFFFLPFVLLSMVLSVLSFIREDLSKKQAGKVFNSEKSGKDEVSARAWVEPGDFKPEEPLRCWIRLENLTDGPVTDLRFDSAEILPQPGGASLGALKGSLNQELRARLPQPPGAGNPAALGSNHSISFWITLDSPGQEDQYEIDLLYRWSQAGKTGENRLLIGPLESLSREERWARVGASVYGVGKDLALPIALAVLTFLFSNWERKYEQRRQKTEKEREDARRAVEAEREQAHKEAERHTQQARETWARMLSISHRDTKKYYLPILSSVRRLILQLEKPKGTPEREDQAFYHLMVFLRLMKRLKDENGGLYLKSRAGEDALSGLWFILQQDLEEAFTVKHFGLAIASVRPDEPYADFMAKLGGRRSPDLRECRQRFSVWLGQGFSDYLPLLLLFHRVLSYEANLAYVYWYGDIEMPPVEEVSVQQTKLFQGPLADKVRAAGVGKDLDRFRWQSMARYRRLKTKLQDVEEVGSSRIS